MKPTSQILFLTLLLSILLGSLHADDIKVEKGELDLTNYPLSRNKSVKLQGDWEFYWKELYFPSDFQNKRTKPPQYLSFPKVWNDLVVGEDTLTGFGYATYRLKIKINSSDKSLALKVPTTGTNANIFVNGINILEVGKVGVNPETSVPMLDPTILDLDFDTNELEIVIMISNFNYAKGGPWKNFILGNELILRKEHESSVFFDFFLLGAFVIIGFYFIGLFVLRKKERFNLWFGLGAFAAGLRVSASGEYVISYLEFPEYEMIIGAEIFSFYIGIGILATYLNSIFQEEFNKKALQTIQLFSVAHALLVLFTPASLYSYTVNYFQIVTLIILIYISYVVGMAIFKKRSGSLIFAVGFFLLVIFILNDIYLNFQQNYDLHLTGFGFFIFMVVQSYLVSFRFTTTFNDNERLTIELNTINQSLEKRVEERTRELNESLEELRATQGELQHVNDELEKSNIAKDKLFSIIGHDLRGPLNSINVSMEYLIEDMDEMEVREIKNDLTILNKAGQSAAHLLNNLFEWSKTQTGTIEFNPKNYQLIQSANAAIDLLSENARSKNILIRNFVKEDMFVHADKNMINTVVRNLLNNAIKFSDTGGKINLNAVIKDTEMIFSVEDNGVGIPEDKVETIFKVYKNKSTRGTGDEKGTGLGLIICKEFVEINQGKIWVESQLNEGTTFSFSIPLSK